MTTRRLGALAAAALALLLAGCLLLPGHFSSSLAVRRDGTFGFAYTGQIFLLPLAEPDKAKSEAQPFKPDPCYDDATIEERPCTKDEVAEQKAKWDEAQKASSDKKNNDAEMMKAMMGGLDPSDPKAGEEFASRLMRQEGWKSVVYRGNGLFDVDYAITARLDHDFVFPTIEKMPGVQPFVTIVRRNDGTVRVEAPAFSSGPAASPMLAIMQSMGAKPSKQDEDKMPRAEGDFSVVTDGEILANDTDEGPKNDPAGKRLHWQVGAQTTSVPSALIRVGS